MSSPKSDLMNPVNPPPLLPKKNTPEERKLAQRQVARHSTGPDDLVLMLDMIGLNEEWA